MIGPSYRIWGCLFGATALPIPHTYLPCAERITARHLYTRCVPRVGLFGAGDRIRTCENFRYWITKPVLSTTQPPRLNFGAPGENRTPTCWFRRPAAIVHWQGHVWRKTAESNHYRDHQYHGFQGRLPTVRRRLPYVWWGHRDSNSEP